MTSATVAAGEEDSGSGQGEGGRRGGGVQPHWGMTSSKIPQKVASAASHGGSGLEVNFRVGPAGDLSVAGQRPALGLGTPGQPGSL